MLLTVFQSLQAAVYLGSDAFPLSRQCNKADIYKRKRWLSILGIAWCKNQNHKQNQVAYKGNSKSWK